MMTQVLAHGISTEMTYPALIVLFVIVLGLWIWGQISPKIKRFRISTAASFVLLCATLTIMLLSKKFFPAAAAVDTFALILIYIILLPGGLITLLIWGFLSAAECQVSMNDDSFWVCILVFSFAINAFVVFGIIKLAQYIRGKYSVRKQK